MILAIFGISPASWVTSFVTAMFKDALGAIGSAAADVLGALVGFMNTTTDPVFSAGWWTTSGASVFVRVLAVAGGLMFIGFAMSVVSSVLSHDQSIMAKAALHLPLAAIEMAALVAVTAALVSASDELATYIAGGGGKGLTAFVTGTLAVAVATGGIVGMLLAGFIIVAGLLVWAVLIVRTALIYVAVMSGPLIFASAIHPATRHVRKRYVEGGIALIGSKVIMAIAFATGSAMLGGIGSSPSFSAAIGALMQALAILLIAAFAPFLFIKLLIAAEALTIAEGAERRPLRATMSGASGVYHAAGLKHMMGRLNNGGGDSSGGGEDDGGGSDPGGSGGSPSRPSGPRSAWQRTNVARAAAATRRLATRAASGARGGGADPPASPHRDDEAAGNGGAPPTDVADTTSSRSRPIRTSTRSPSRTTSGGSASPASASAENQGQTAHESIAGASAGSGSVEAATGTAGTSRSTPPTTVGTARPRTSSGETSSTPLEGAGEAAAQRASEVTPQPSGPSTPAPSAPGRPGDEPRPTSRPAPPRTPTPRPAMSAPLTSPPTNGPSAPIVSLPISSVSEEGDVA